MNDMMLVAIVDDREDPTIPPLDPTVLDVDSVVEALKVEVDDARPLTITVYVGEGAKSMPTSYSHPTDENLCHWHLHLLLRPKRDLTSGSVRAINRAISRECWAIKMMRDEFVWLEAAESKDINEAQTKFADESPKALVVDGGE